MEQFKRHLMCVGIWLGVLAGMALTIALIFGFVALAAHTANFLTGYLGQPWGGLAALFIFLIAPVTLFFSKQLCDEYERNKRNKEWRNKWNEDQVSDL